MMTIIPKLNILLLFSINIVAQEGIVSIEQDSIVTMLLELKQDNDIIRPYKIQIYQSDDPDSAAEIKNHFLSLFENWQVAIKWIYPEYRVWVGNFGSRLEADRAALNIIKDYPTAFVLKPKATFENNSD